MNNTMGRFIDGLTDEQRDRIVEAKDFTDGWDWWDGECGCLVGTIEEGAGAIAIKMIAASMQVRYKRWRHLFPHHRFPMAVARFGKARIVHAIKARAGAKVESLAELAHA